MAGQERGSNPRSRDRRGANTLDIERETTREGFCGEHERAIRQLPKSGLGPIVRGIVGVSIDGAAGNRT